MLRKRFRLPDCRRGVLWPKFLRIPNPIISFNYDVILSKFYIRLDRRTNNPVRFSPPGFCQYPWEKKRKFRFFGPLKGSAFSVERCRCPTHKKVSTLRSSSLSPSARRSVRPIQPARWSYSFLKKKANT